MVRHVLVVGSGCAGLLAAVNLRSAVPALRVRVLPVAGDQGGGPGALACGPGFVRHLHEELRLEVAGLFRAARPTWRLGTRYFDWGPRPCFDHAHDFQLDTRYARLSRETGYYVDAEGPMDSVGAASALMTEGRAFVRGRDGRPEVLPGRFGYHLEAEPLERYLEELARRAGVEFLPPAEADAALPEADLRVLSVPLPGLAWEAWGLPCDRMAVASIPRAAGEAVRPYTAIRAVPEGWCWRTEHAASLGVGLAYRAELTGDDEARAALAAAHPGAEKDVRFIALRGGRAPVAWEADVVRVGPAASILEPLAPMALDLLAFECRWLALSLNDCDLEPRPTLARQYSKRCRRLAVTWRDFLALLYRHNHRFHSPFWRHARQAAADAGDLAPLEAFYRDVGPSSLHRHALLHEEDPIGLEGYYSALVGQSVPFDRSFEPSPEEAENWRQAQRVHRRRAAGGVTVEEATAMLLRQAEAVTPMPTLTLTNVPGVITEVRR